jgi:hypothetical protein
MPSLLALNADHRASAIFLSAFPYNVTRTEKPPGVFPRMI